MEQQPILVASFNFGRSPACEFPSRAAHASATWGPGLDTWNFWTSLAGASKSVGASSSFLFVGSNPLK